VVFGTPFLVGAGRPQEALGDVADDARVVVAQRGEVLLHYRGGTKVLVASTFDGPARVLPSAVVLLPQADGRWWTTEGPLERWRGLSQSRFPVGKIAVAGLRNGYLLVGEDRRGLFRWQSGSAPERIGAGASQVLAIAGDRIAWTDGFHPVVHVTMLGPEGGADTVDIPFSFDAVTARFSPDGTRLAMLTGTQAQSMVLADTGTGRTIAQLVTASGGNALTSYADLPPAFQPVPFSWDSSGRLVVVAQTTVGYFVNTIDSQRGFVLRTVRAPEGLQQLISLDS
jgi:hypothetical protein